MLHYTVLALYSFWSITSDLFELRAELGHPCVKVSRDWRRPRFYEISLHFRPTAKFYIVMLVIIDMLTRLSRKFLSIRSSYFSCITWSNKKAFYYFLYVSVHQLVILTWRLAVWQLNASCSGPGIAINKVVIMKWSYRFFSESSSWLVKRSTRSPATLVCRCDSANLGSEAGGTRKKNINEWKKRSLLRFDRRKEKQTK